MFTIGSGATRKVLFRGILPPEPTLCRPSCRTLGRSSPSAGTFSRRKGESRGQSTVSGSGPCAVPATRRFAGLESPAHRQARPPALQWPLTFRTQYANGFGEFSP